MTNGQRVETDVNRFIAEYESLPLWKPFPVHGDAILMKTLEGVSVKKQFTNPAHGFVSFHVDVLDSKRICDAVCWVVQTVIGANLDR